MMTIVLLLFIFLLISDNLIINHLRQLLRAFLSSKENKAIAIHRKQCRKDRITMDYIEPLLKRNIKPFRKWHKFYKFNLFELIPQYIILTILFVFLEENLRFVLYGLCFIKYIISSVVRMQFDSSFVSRYVKRK